MKFLMKKVAAAAMAGGFMFAAVIGGVSAAPLFTINPNAIPGVTAGIPFVADTVSGISSELLHLTSGGAVANSGTLQFSGFSNSTNSTVIGAGTSRLTVDYNLYLIFDLSTTYLSGGLGNGTAGAHYRIDSLNFALYADPQRDTTFSGASSLGGGTEANRTGGFGNDILLAFGGLVPSTPNSADLTGGGGAALNAITSFGVCQGGNAADFGGVPVAFAGCTSNVGANYFAAPHPFYQLALSGFNNPGGGVTRTGDLVSINNAAASIVFANVPEPGSLALLGVALAGVGLTSRRRKLDVKA